MKTPQGQAKGARNIKTSLMSVLVLLAMLFLIPTAMDVYDSHRRLEESRRMAVMINVGIDLFKATQSLGYERGRVNVVLNHQGPLGEMAENRAFIAQRRQDGERALDRALAALAEAGSPKAAVSLATLRQAREKVMSLRHKVDAEMLMAKDARAPQLRADWFAAMSRMLAGVRDVLEVVCAEAFHFDGKTTVVMQLMLASISLRDQCAPEMSLLSGVMLSGRPVSEETRLEIIGRRGATRQLWRDMRTWSVALGSPRVDQLAAQFQQKYFDQYWPLGQETLRASATAGPYRVAQKQFLQQGVAAIEVLAQFMDAVVEVGAQRAEQIGAQAMGAFVASVATLALGVSLIVAAIGLAAVWIINPLASLTQITRDVAKRRLDVAVPYMERRDEVGSLARAVDTLKDNTRQMIADFDALHKSNQELERALAEVRTLSGLLPICANCKKIRDDSGYWQQIEQYISSHSQAEFSHGICPECLRKLYPEIADEVLSRTK